MAALLVAGIVIVGAYVLGTFPSAVLVGALHGVDPTAVGSRNPGATNSYRTMGRRAGVTVLILDLAKGAIAAGVGLLVGGSGLAMAVGAASVAGHVFPVTRRFEGGKGVATAAGVVVVTFPVAALAVLLVFLAVLLVTRIASVASVAGSAAAPVLVTLTGASLNEALAMAAISAVVVYRHRPNLERLLTGEEPATKSG